jgi:uroporphyrinogen III methyltransferase/synthase
LTAAAPLAILTRPAGQCGALAAALAREGVATLDFPLIGIAPARDTAPLAAALASLSDYALALFVSPNAIDCALDGAAPWPRAVPVGVVGPGSVRALSRHGIAPDTHTVIFPQAAADDPEARFDSEGLLAALDARFGLAALSRRRVLLVRGDGGRELLAETLRAAGARVDIVAAYRRFAPTPAPQAWEALRAGLATGRAAWVLTSSEGVRNLAALAAAHLDAAARAALFAAPALAPHPRIAEAARAAGFDSITVSGAGDDNLVRALLVIAGQPPCSA